MDEGKRLEAATERLNEALDLADEVLRERGYRTRARIELEPRVWLCWTQLRGVWGVALFREGRTPQPIRTAPREFRIRAAQSLPALHQEILRAQEA